MAQDDEFDAGHSDDEDEVPRVFRIHGVGVITRDGQLPTLKRLLVEDEDGCEIRLVLERENQFGGDAQRIPLGDHEAVELLRALELVAKRRGLIDPLGN